jgi:hypothetical protein
MRFSNLFVAERAVVADAVLSVPTGVVAVEVTAAAAAVGVAAVVGRIAVGVVVGVAVGVAVGAVVEIAVAVVVAVVVGAAVVSVAVGWARQEIAWLIFSVVAELGACDEDSEMAYQNAAVSVILDAAAAAAAAAEHKNENIDFGSDCEVVEVVAVGRVC